MDSRSIAGQLRSMWRVIACMCVIWILACVPASASEEAAVVERLHATLIGLMQDAEQLGYQGRHQQLETVIPEVFDLSYAARLTVAKFWKTWTDEQQATLTTTFQELSIATYASRFDGYAGESFRVISEKPLRRGRVLVKSLFTKSNGDELHFDYVLHQVNAQWRIMNVTVDGVSDLALKRAEYTSILQREGYAALISTLQKQIRNHAPTP